MPGSTASSFSVGSQSLPIGPHLEGRLSARPAEAVVGVRPQHLSLVPMARRSQAKLANAEFMGHEVYLHADLEGQRVVSRRRYCRFRGAGPLGNHPTASGAWSDCTFSTRPTAATSRCEEA